MAMQTTASKEANDPRAALEAVARALSREAHVLAQRPELTWQQLYNRLQWADPPLAEQLAAERQRRSAPGAHPWIHRYTRLRESGALLRILSGHTDQVWACAISPDGAWIVSASRDGTLKIWDAATGAERATLVGHVDWVWGCAISPDGAWIVSTSNDSTLKIWDAATGAERATLVGHADAVKTCAVSPDGAWIVSGCRDRTLKIWDASTGAVRATLVGHGNAVRACAVSPDGRWIVSASDDQTLRIWDVATGAERGTLVGHTDQVWSCAVSPDGAWIVSGSRDRTLRIWDVATRAERASLEGPTDRVRACAVSPDGAWIVSGGIDRTLRIWDAGSGAQRVSLTGHADWVEACAVGPGGSSIVSASNDRTLRIWDAATAVEQAGLTSPAGRAEDSAWRPDALRFGDRMEYCAISPDGTWIVSASDLGTLTIHDASTGAPRTTLVGHTGPVLGCAIGPDGAWIVSASLDETLKIWDAATGAERATLVGHSDAVRACAISPDGAWIVSASDDHTLKIWDASTGAERATLASHGDMVWGCAISPDGAWIVSASFDRTLKIWDASTGAERATLAGHGDIVWGCAISPDGGWIVSACRDHTLKVWDTSTGAERMTLIGPTASVGDCAISPDGRWIVSTSDDVKIWDVATGMERASLVLPVAAAAVAWHPFAPMLACGDEGGSVHLARLVGIELGPLVVTATEDRGTPIVRCPACRESFSMASDRLGTQLPCPRPTCGTELRVNSFVVRREGPRKRVGRAAGPRLPVDAPARPARPHGQRSNHLTAPEIRPIPSLMDLVAQSGLRCLDVGVGTLALPFESTRAEQLVVQARTLEGGLAFLLVPLPAPGMFGGEAALRSLLRVSVTADYVKALVFPDGKLALACEQQLSLLAPARVRGLAAGLAALGDVKKGDLADASGWDRRLLACRLAQAAHITLDPASALAAIRRFAAEGGLPVHEREAGALVVELDLVGAGAPLRVVVRVSEHLVSLIAYLGDTKPKGNKGAYMRRMLELNRAANVARLGLDADGDVALLYEVPEVPPDLFDRVREQFGLLLAGLVDLERGR
jgi:WD40 repeat protein